MDGEDWARFGEGLFAAQRFLEWVRRGPGRDTLLGALADQAIGPMAALADYAADEVMNPDHPRGWGYLAGAKPAFGQDARP